MGGGALPQAQEHYQIPPPLQRDRLIHQSRLVSTPWPLRLPQYHSLLTKNTPREYEDPSQASSSRGALGTRTRPSTSQDSRLALGPDSHHKGPSRKRKCSSANSHRTSRKCRTL